MYKITQTPPAAPKLAEIIVRQCDQLPQAVTGLEKHDKVLDYCVEINRLWILTIPASAVVAALVFLAIHLWIPNA